MCRMIAIKADARVQTQYFLRHAENALRKQGAHCRDGWGVGYYDNQRPRQLRKTTNAATDPGFLEGVSELDTRLLISHLRGASVGEVKTENCHPFQYGNWLFAHSGELSKVAEVRDKLRSILAPELMATVRGDTDSELCFAAFLHVLNGMNIDPRADVSPDPQVFQAAITECISLLDRLALEAGAEVPSRLTFLVSNGHLLAAARRGYELHYRQAEVPGKGNVFEYERYVGFASEPIEMDGWSVMPQDSCAVVYEDEEEMSVRMRISPMSTLNPDQHDILAAFIQDYLSGLQSD